MTGAPGLGDLGSLPIFWAGAKFGTIDSTSAKD